MIFYTAPLLCLVAVVTLEPCEGADTYVNGKKVTEPSILRSGMDRGPALLLQEDLGRWGLCVHPLLGTVCSQQKAALLWALAQALETL